MVTRSDFDSIMQVRNSFCISGREALSGEEIGFIRDTLELESRNDIELENIKTLVTLVYSVLEDNASDLENASCFRDTSSVIRGVIDWEIARRHFAW